MNTPTAERRRPFPWLVLALALLLCAVVLACSDRPEPASVPEQVSDIDVTSNVTTALLRVPQLQGKQIAVVTTQGDVRLTAVLDSQEQIDAALRVARAAAGVHSLHDELTLRP